MEVIQDRPSLQAEGFDDRQNSFDKATAGFTMATKRVFAPQHTRTQNTFDMIVRWSLVESGPGRPRRLRARGSH